MLLVFKKVSPVYTRAEVKWNIVAIQKVAISRSKASKFRSPISISYLIVNFEEQEIAAYEKKLFSSVSKIKTTPSMERLLAELKDICLYRGGLGYIYLDWKSYWS